MGTNTNWLPHGAVNDVKGSTYTVIDGNKVSCPMYRTWRNMIRRCYYKKYLEEYPSYIGCSVCSEWLLFSKFKAWMSTQDYKGNELDKDILQQGNKIYSPDTCMFVPPNVNKLINRKGSKVGDMPTGVYKVSKYTARVYSDGKQFNLGDFNNPEDAHEAYKRFKYKIIAKEAARQSEPLRSALLSIVLD